MRETNPRPDRPATTAGAAAELAERLNSTADKQAARWPHSRPWSRSRARSRSANAPAPGRALAAVLRDLRDPAKREASPQLALAAAEVKAHAAMDRLEQNSAGAPADDLAQELADELRRHRGRRRASNGKAGCRRDH